jgi:hypothetical protein
VVDDATSEPIADVTLAAVWSFDSGDGLLGPAGSQVSTHTTDAAGRFRIPPVPGGRRGHSLRLVDVVIVAYKRGYLAWRSDLEPDGRPRKDFSARQNKIRLRKWRETDSHADHLLYVAAPAEIADRLEWEAIAANTSLLRRLRGEDEAEARARELDLSRPTRPLLDATALLAPEDITVRTGFADSFEIRELGDYPRESFYHGVHLQAVDRDETYDVAYRVWKAPPSGLDSVKATFEATLPSVDPSDEITAETWTHDAGDVRAVAFIDRAAEVAVLLTCGGEQCADLATAIILAKVIHGRIDRLRIEDIAVSGSPATPPATAPTPTPASAGKPAPPAPPGGPP